MTMKDQIHKRTPPLYDGHPETKIRRHPPIEIRLRSPCRHPQQSNLHFEKDEFRTSPFDIMHADMVDAEDCRHNEEGVADLETGERRDRYRSAMTEELRREEEGVKLRALWRA